MQLPLAVKSNGNFHEWFNPKKEYKSYFSFRNLVESAESHRFAFYYYPSLIKKIIKHFFHFVLSFLHDNF